MKGKIGLVVLLLSVQLYAADGKKIIVIGASSGIGKSIAKKFAQQKYTVGITGRRVNLLEELKNQYPQKMQIQFMDVTKVEEARENFTKLVAAMGGVDIVVINAGVFPDEALTADKQIPYKATQEIIKVNVEGFAALANEAMNYFLKQGHGHLVGISSLDAVKGHALGPVYCGSKSFVAHYLEGLRNFCIQNNIPIDVTEIRPGCIATFDVPPNNLWYWVTSADYAAESIFTAIEKKKKIAYSPGRWAVIALLLKITPDWIYNKLGGF